jgi:hypothetical protein
MPDPNAGVEPQDPGQGAKPDGRKTTGDPDLLSLLDRLPASYDLHNGLIHRWLPDGGQTAICGPVMLRSRARTAEGAGWCAEVRFQAMDGEWRTEVVAMKDLTGAPARVAAALVDRGFDLRGRPREVCDLLKAMEPEAVGLAVDATGWVGSGWDTFVCPSGRILTHEGRTQGVLFSGRVRLVGAPRGTACAAGTGLLNRSVTDAGGAMPVITDHRGSEAHLPPPRAEDVLRLRRIGQLDRTDLPREHAPISPGHPPAPAHRGGHVRTAPPHHHDRRGCGDARRARPGRADGMQHADGEILAARAAEKFGVPFTLSTMSICSIEDVAAHTQAAFWFQLYVMRTRTSCERLLRAREGRGLFGAGHHARPADPRPAPQGPEERPVRPAEADAPPC